MNVLIVYDSLHGNTEQVAQAIGEVVNGQVIFVGNLYTVELNNFELIIIGSPTHGGFPSEGIHAFLKKPSMLKGKRAAAFDTRTKTTIFGYAAPKMAKSLHKFGADLIAPPEGFFVIGTKGPLIEGELARATRWAEQLLQS